MDTLISKQVNRGIFIVIEGLDRCGKSSQCSKLIANIKNLGKEVIGKKAPERSTPIGQMINSYLQGTQNHNDQTIHLLFSANRWEDQENVKSLLNKGISIVQDRYAYSGAAYTAAKGLNLEWCKSCDKGLIEPDIIFYLQAPKEIIKQRAGFGGERYEKEEFQEKVREQFNLIRQNDKKFVSIDASQAIEEVEVAIFQKYKEYLSNVDYSKELQQLWII